MDYSLLLSIKKYFSIDERRLTFHDTFGNAITLGIIDFFQDYDLGKQGEKAVKSLFNKTKEVSSMDPEQ